MSRVDSGIRRGSYGQLRAQSDQVMTRNIKFKRKSIVGDTQLLPLPIIRSDIVNESVSRYFQFKDAISRLQLPQVNRNSISIDLRIGNPKNKKKLPPRRKAVLPTIEPMITPSYSKKLNLEVRQLRKQANRINGKRNRMKPVTVVTEQNSPRRLELELLLPNKPIGSLGNRQSPQRSLQECDMSRIETEKTDPFEMPELSEFLD